MHVWLRGIAATAAGLLAGIALISAVQALGMALYSPPADFDPADQEALARLVRNMPVGALLMVEASYAIGSLATGIVVGLIARRRAVAPACICGGLLTAAGFANLAAIPHPMWFAVLSTATYVPCTLLGVVGIARWRAGDAQALR